MVYNANGLYPHKAQISNEFNSSAVSNKGILACQGYSFEEYPEAFDMYPFCALNLRKSTKKNVQEFLINESIFRQKLVKTGHNYRIVSILTCFGTNRHKLATRTGR